MLNRKTLIARGTDFSNIVLNEEAAAETVRNEKTTPFEMRSSRTKTGPRSGGTDIEGLVVGLPAKGGGGGVR